jgi:hypothetical protein
MHRIQEHSMATPKKPTTSSSKPTTKPAGTKKEGSKSGVTAKKSR